jgi:hypothetical protein
MNVWGLTHYHRGHLQTWKDGIMVEHMMQRSFNACQRSIPIILKVWTCSPLYVSLTYASVFLSGIYRLPDPEPRVLSDMLPLLCAVALDYEINGPMSIEDLPSEVIWRIRAGS